MAIKWLQVIVSYERMQAAVAVKLGSKERVPMMVTPELRADFKHFLYNGPSMMTGRQAEMALRDAKTLAKWRELEAQGLVRLVAEPEQESYFDVFGEADNEKERKAILEALEDKGCHWVAAEYRASTCNNPDHDGWEQADSIGMCVYDDPADPFENCYVIQLMQSAIDKLEEMAH